MSDNDEEKNVSKKFSHNVVNWVKIDDKLRELRGIQKELTQEKKHLEEEILKYLDSIGEKMITIGDGKLRVNTSKTKEPLKKENIYEKLKEFTNDEGKASILTEDIYENRPLKQRINLKRTKQRGKKDDK